MDYQWIRVETGRIARLWLNRPEKSNAFHDGMIEELRHALAALLLDESVRVVLLAAEGRHFSAGADLNWMQRMAQASEEDNYRDALALARLMQQLASYPKPLICLAQGACYGGGVGLVAASGIALVADDARFCLSEVKLGLIPAVISPYVVAAMGRRAAQRYMLSAEIIDAATACHLGLASECCLADQLQARGLALAEQLAGNAPQAQREVLELLQRVAPLPDETLVEDTARRIARIRVGAEGQAGMRAFLEKRNPPWQEGA